MTITLFLIPYTLFLIVDVLLSAFAIYHLFKFSVQNRVTLLATFLYVAAAATILFFSFTAIAQIEWTRFLYPMPLSDAFQYMPTYDTP